MHYMSITPRNASATTQNLAKDPFWKPPVTPKVLALLVAVTVAMLYVLTSPTDPEMVPTPADPEEGLANTE